MVEGEEQAVSANAPAANRDRRDAFREIMGKPGYCAPAARAATPAS